MDNLCVDTQPLERVTTNRVEISNVSSPLAWEAFVRAGLAFIFVFIFAGTVIGMFLFVGQSCWADAKELLQILLPAETALLGSAVGFYFGTRSKQ